MTQTVIAFDLYGTLLSTESIATELAKLYGEDKAKALAARARTLQLEYTWRCNSMSESTYLWKKASPFQISNISDAFLLVREIPKLQ